MYLVKNDTFYKSSLIIIKTFVLIKTFYIIEMAIECRLTSTKDFFDIKDKKCFSWAIKVGGVFSIHTVNNDTKTDEVFHICSRVFNMKRLFRY